jgi:hypothetical protein
MPSGRVGKAGGALMLCALALAARAAAPPVELTKGQRDKRDVRDCLEGQLSRLIQKRQYDAVLKAVERIASLDEEVLGVTHPRAIRSQRRLAAWREAQRRFSVPGGDKPAKAGPGLPSYYGKLFLREGQKQAILKLRAAYQAKRDALPRQIDQLKAEEKKALEAVLTAEQRKRLHELRNFGGPTGKPKPTDKGKGKEASAG